MIRGASDDNKWSHDALLAEINFLTVTLLSKVVLISYLAWCLFGTISISHIARCYDN